MYGQKNVLDHQKCVVIFHDLDVTSMKVIYRKNHNHTSSLLLNSRLYYNRTEVERIEPFFSIQLYRQKIIQQERKCVTQNKIIVSVLTQLRGAFIIFPDCSNSIKTTKDNSMKFYTCIAYHTTSMTIIKNITVVPLQNILLVTIEMLHLSYGAF